MLKKWMMLFSLLLPLMGCNKLSFLQGQTNQPMIPVKIETLFFTPGDFTHIDVRGELILNIHMGARNPWFSMHGDARDLRNIEWKLKTKTRTLRIRLDGRFPKHGPVTIDIGVKELSGILYHGNGNVTGRRLRSGGMDLDIDNAKNTTTLLEGRMNLQHVSLRGEGTYIINDRGYYPHLHLNVSEKAHVTMKGRMSPQFLEMTGSSFLNLQRVQTKDLRVTMHDQSGARLAGSAQWALIKGDGNSRFDGQYLRTTEAFVKTDDYAIAQIFVTSKQHTLASGHSNIYYYNVPTYQTDFMAKDGSVLNLGAEKTRSRPKK